MENKKISRIYISEVCEWVESDEENQIEEFNVNGEMAPVRWFRKGKSEYNGRYVLIVRYF